MSEQQVTEDDVADVRRKPTVEEAEAILLLVRGGWLKMELTLSDE